MLLIVPPNSPMLRFDDDSLHKYSLERLGITQCGKMSQYQDCYPPEVYNLLVYNPSTSVIPVTNNAWIFDPIFDETCDKSLMSRKLYQIDNDPQIFTVTSVLEIRMKSIFAGVCVTDEEANYSHYVTWPLLGTIVVTVELKSHCGEYHLTRNFPKEIFAAMSTTNLMTVF